MDIENQIKRKVDICGVNLGYFIDDYELLNDNNTKQTFSVDKIYVISLEYRDDRRKILFENLKKINLKKITLFIPRKAIEITNEELQKLNNVIYDNYNSKITNYTVFGCFLSHLLCFKDANNLKLDNIMILEDDCEFFNIPGNVISNINNFITNETYDAFFLHNVSHKFITPYLSTKYIKKRILDNFDIGRFTIINKYNGIKIIIGTSLAHCIIYSKKYISFLSELKIPLKNNKVRNFDYVLKVLGKKFNYYSTDKTYTTQFESFSDITLENVKKGI